MMFAMILTYFIYLEEPFVDYAPDLILYTEMLAENTLPIYAYPDASIQKIKNA